jgi:nicotinamidase/pyrazinamidase
MASLRDHEIDPGTSALIVVDLQPDFLPGGALAVAGGDEILAPIAALMESRAFELVAATQDWHPPGHVSFASSHQGREPFEAIELYGQSQVLWPDHCVQGTPGAELHADLPWQRADVVIRKGTDPEVDSYSGFRNNWTARGERPPTGLAGLLRERGIEQVYICGLARDYCCRWSAEDAAQAGFDVHFLWDLTRSVDPGGDSQLERNLESAEVQILTDAERGS